MLKATIWVQKYMGEPMFNAFLTKYLIRSYRTITPAFNWRNKTHFIAGSVDLPTINLGVFYSYNAHITVLDATHRKNSTVFSMD